MIIHQRRTAVEWRVWSIVFGILAVAGLGVSSLGDLRLPLSGLAFVLAVIAFAGEYRAGGISRELLFWGVLAAVGGVCSMVLPPFLSPGGMKEEPYGWPVIPWFALAWANVRPVPSAACFFVVGMTLVMAPRRWGTFLLPFVAASGPAVLMAINMMNDWARDATSHNLWPFEVLIYAVISSPALIGALLGSLLRRFLQRPGAA